MAESWCPAFGRYLRAVRLRRGLSLQEVCSLSQAFSETLNKGYVSRAENGHSTMAFSKIIPMARIYRVPADVMLERLELDMELDRVGGPDTDGLTFEALINAGEEAMAQGFGWNAYAYFRDAIPLAETDAIASFYRDRNEQVACAYVGCASAAYTQGRKRFTLHEFKFVEDSGALGPRYRPILYERISRVYRSLGQLDVAVDYSHRAMLEAEILGESDRLAHAYSNRAHLAFKSGDLEMAAGLFRLAYDAFKDAGVPHGCAVSLNNLAQVYFEQGRNRTSRRMLMAAEKLSRPLEHHRAQALGRILMGEIDAAEQHQELAARRWKEAADIAKRLNDKALRFRAEVYLFRQAHRSGDNLTAKTLQRRLRKLAHWVPPDLPELATFRQLVAERESGTIH